MKAVAKFDIKNGKAVVVFTDGTEQEMYEFPSEESGGGGTQPVLGTKNIINNGIYNAEDDGYDGYSSVSVAVSQPTPILGRKTITENGVYNASQDGVDGYQQVTVNVQSSGGVDFSNAIGSYENRSFGSLFASISEGKFGAIQKIITSGTNPVEVQFPTDIELKGILWYPIDLPFSEMANDNLLFDVMVLDTVYDTETNAQQAAWSVYRGKGSSVHGLGYANRLTSGTLINNKLSLVPNYPSNQSYNPFKFGAKYAFVYWY